MSVAGVSLPAGHGQPILSNYLAELADQAGNCYVAYGHFRRASIEQWHAAAERVAEARKTARHGEWGLFLKRAGIHARVARNMVQLISHGFTVEQIENAGGINAARALVSPRRLRPRHLVRLIVRQGAVCGICDERLPEDEAMIDIDHVIPISHGGNDDVENLQAVCHGCNLRKGASRRRESRAGWSPRHHDHARRRQ